MSYKIVSAFVFLIFGVVGVHYKKAGNDINMIPGNRKEPTTVKEVETPRIDFISTIPVQPQEKDTNVIWFDDFDDVKIYMESRGDLDNKVHFGAYGSSMKAGFKKGDITGEGDRKVAFGDFPEATPTLKKGEKFDEIYWRIYVKHEHAWEGAPAKMSRATSIVSGNWQQAMIAHVWSGGNNTITLDPARGVEGQTDQIKTTKYNDFENLTWLGNKPTSRFRISSTKESGYWVMVEARAKLNTPGKADGVNQLWIDGRLEAERLKLNFRGKYTTHGINAVFLESYWNSGSPKTQGRWFENFVISTQPIGPVVCPANPTLYKAPYLGPGQLAGWEVKLATDYEGNDVVYYSSLLGRNEAVVVNTDNGHFSGSLKEKVLLQSGKVYYCSVRQKSLKGDWSDWSRWHQGFKVE